MGMDDRDYYREWWRKKQGFTEKAPFRLPASYRQQKQTLPHWSLVLLAVYFAGLAVYLVVKAVF